MIRALTIAQMNAATPRLNGNGTLTNLRNGETCTVRIVNPGTWHHSDFEPTTRADAVTLLRWAGGRWSWNPVPCTLSWSNNVTACSIHTMPHAGHLYGRFSFNVMTDSALRLNAQGSHFCLHYINSMEVRFRNKQTSRDWWQRMNNAVHDAVRLANANNVTPPQPPVQPPPPTSPPPPPTFQQYRVRVTALRGLNVRSGAGTNFRIVADNAGRNLALSRNSEVTVIGESTGQGARRWGRVMQNNRAIGWIAMQSALGVNWVKRI